MRRSGFLERKTELLRGGGPKRKTPLRQVSAKRVARPKKTKRAQPAVPASVRKRLAARSKGVCEVGLHVCTGVATDPQHRITQKAGGRHGEAKVHHDRLSNLLHCCRPCHDHITGEPFESYQNGWSCKEGADTEAEPVVSHGVLVYLTDAGRVIPFGGRSDSDPYPACGHEFHGADGGACPGCGFNSHPIPTEPTPPLPTPPWEMAGVPLTHNPAEEATL